MNGYVSAGTGIDLSRIAHEDAISITIKGRMLICVQDHGRGLLRIRILLQV